MNSKMQAKGNSSAGSVKVQKMEWLTIEQVAKEAGCSMATVGTVMVKEKGWLTPSKLGLRNIFSRDQVEEAIPKYEQHKKDIEKRKLDAANQARAIKNGKPVIAAPVAAVVQPAPTVIEQKVDLAPLLARFDELGRLIVAQNELLAKIASHCDRNANIVQHAANNKLPTIEGNLTKIFTEASKTNQTLEILVQELRGPAKV